MAASFRAILIQNLDFRTKTGKNSDVELVFFQFRCLNQMFVGRRQVPISFNTCLDSLKEFPLAKTVTNQPKKDFGRLKQD